MKKAPRMVSHLIKRSPLSLKTRKYHVALKLEQPCWNIHFWLPLQPMILAPENTHQWSKLQYSQQGSMKPTSGIYLRRIHSSSIIAINYSKRRAIQNSHQRSTLSMASWTTSSSLLNYSTAMILRDRIFYRNSSPGLKSFSIRCVEANLKLWNNFLSSARESTKNKGAHFLTPLTTSLRLGLLSSREMIWTPSDTFVPPK